MLASSLLHGASDVAHPAGGGLRTSFARSHTQREGLYYLRYTWGSDNSQSLVNILVHSLSMFIMFGYMVKVILDLFRVILFGFVTTLNHALLPHHIDGSVL